jgi:hypothetical protein
MNAAEPLADAKADAVAVLRDLGGRNALRDRRIEDARTVDMHRNALPGGQRTQLRHVIQRQRRAARAVVRGLDADQRGRKLVGGELRAEPLLDLDEIGRAARRGDRAIEKPGERGDAAHLAAHDVAIAVEQHLAAAPGVGEQRHQIRHRAAGDEQGGLLAGDRGGHLFQPPHGRIALARVVAELGAAHRLAHLLGRQGHCVASQIDHRLFPVIASTIRAAAAGGRPAPPARPCR